jgi:diguanylate cyclase (GGDEF)-like protein
MTERKIQGLNLGAVDYITKPYDPAEFTARVRAALRTKHLQDLLATQALIDGLTELWNRRYFDRRLQAEVSLAARSGHAFSCILCDIDHFKSLNDRYGHSFGDFALRQVARVLRDGCRQEDVVCRYGGEEFAILLPNTPITGAMEMAERLRSAVEALELVWQENPVHITCSIGVAQASSVEANVIEMADQALYTAKAAGRNRVESANSRLNSQTLTAAGGYR